MTQASPRQPFEPDGATLLESTAQGHAPALSSSGALARFEFEAGKGNEGTKVLMVEWIDENDESRSGDWEVSWEGKKTVISERDGAEDRTHRLYFLLAPGAAIPPIVKISQKAGQTMQTNPLPAIFPPELGASARTAGRKGVLHTRWGKQRLMALDKEIEEEMRKNVESIGLEMARQEKQWIVDNFGIGSKPIPDILDPLTPSSPKSPGGGRLAEKLKGLKLGTSASDLKTRSIDNSEDAVHRQHPLSPDNGDVAISSFALFHGGGSRPAPRAVGQSPPSHIRAQQAESLGNTHMYSLNAVADGSVPAEEADIEDDLFAVNLSPRSPDMARSPFSLSTQDAVPWR